MYSNKFPFLAPPDCEPGQLTCRQYIWNKTYCIPPHYRCDMTVDCIDGSDETECSKFFLFSICQIAIYFKLILLDPLMKIYYSFGYCYRI